MISPPVVLLLLRLISAFLLLLFLAVIAWFIYRDIQIATEFESGRPNPTAKLVVISTELGSIGVGAEFQLSPVTSIGRAPVNSVTLDDEFTSNRHALITWNAGQWLLQDLESKNGTLLNDLPLERETVIVTGDIITIGRTDLRLDL